jgi:hypothetical protein
VIPPARYNIIIFVDIQLIAEVIQQIPGHFLVVKKTNRLPLRTLTEALLHFFIEAFRNIVIEVALNIAREFDRLGCQAVVFENPENLFKV